MFYSTKIQRNGKLWLFGIILACGFAMQHGVNHSSECPFSIGGLGNYLASQGELEGWSADKLPVADSREMQRAVDELLDFSDAEYWHYVSGSDRVSIYVAYWKPGKMSYRLVAGHTPDVCWIANGWVCAAAETLSLRLVGSSLSASVINRYTEDKSTSAFLIGQGDFPIQYRCFELDSRREYVIFGHLVGGRVLVYGPEGPPWRWLLEDLVRRGFNQRESQVFIRVSSNAPIDRMLGLEPVRIFLFRIMQISKRG